MASWKRGAFSIAYPPASYPSDRNLKRFIFLRYPVLLNMERTEKRLLLMWRRRFDDLR